MDVVIAGSHGLIGTALVEHLTRGGHRVRRLVRRPAAGPDEISWDPRGGVLDPAALTGCDAAVNLAGAGLGDHRWTTRYKAEILSSRVRSTSLLALAMARADDGPTVLVQGSAVGFYGDRGDARLDELSARGAGFLADVVEAWEGSTAPAADAGVRVTHARTGIVLSPDGGALGRLLPLVRRGLGGRLGSGREYWSWITLVDEVRALEHLLTRGPAGPVNLTAPEPVTNAEITAALAEAFGRPAVLPVPRLALRAALGEFSSDVLTSARVAPTALLASGFTFTHARLPDAIAWLRAETLSAGR